MNKTTIKLFIIFVVAFLATQFVIVPVAKSIFKPKAASTSR